MRWPACLLPAHTHSPPRPASPPPPPTHTHSERKNVNLPGVVVDLPTLTEKVRPRAPVALCCTVRCACWARRAGQRGALATRAPIRPLSPPPSPPLSGLPLPPPSPLPPRTLTTWCSGGCPTRLTSSPPRSCARAPTSTSSARCVCVRACVCGCVFGEAGGRAGRPRNPPSPLPPSTAPPQPPSPPAHPRTPPPPTPSYPPPPLSGAGAQGAVHQDHLKGGEPRGGVQL